MEGANSTSSANSNAGQGGEGAAAQSGESTQSTQQQVAEATETAKASEESESQAQKKDSKETPTKDEPAEGKKSSDEGESQEGKSLEGEKKEEPQIHDFYKKLSELDPEKKFESDDDRLNYALEVLNQLHDYKGKNQEANKAFLKIFDANPNLINYMRHMQTGMDSEEAFVRTHDIDKVKEIVQRWDEADNEPDESALKKAKQEKLAEAEKRKKAQEDFDSNAAESKKIMDAFAEESGMDDKEAKAFYSAVDGVIGNIFKGVVKKDFLKIMRDGLNYKKDIKEAVDEAKKETEKEVRNEKIEAKKQEKDKTGDNVPNLNRSKEQDKPKRVLDQLSQDIVDFSEKRKKSKIFSN